MSDLRGFTSMSEARDAEEVVRLLNRYLARMSEIIFAYDGIIDEFIGDAILAVFGVPEKRKDDPARAVACALSMQNALHELNDEIISEGYPALEMGIGINSGTVIVGNIGSEMRAKYGIVGTVVNRAARIESNTVGGEVLIGEEKLSPRARFRYNGYSSFGHDERVEESSCLLRGHRDRSSLSRDPESLQRK